MLQGIHTRLETKQLKRLRELAVETGLSVSYLISLILSKWLETEDEKNRAKSKIKRDIKLRGGVARMRGARGGTRR
jgi:hypothetical protein